MNILKNMFDRSLPQRSEPPRLTLAPEIKNSQIAASSEFYQMYNSGVSSAGTAVNEKTAMQISAVYRCVGLIGGAIAITPLNFYKRSENDEREKVKHDLWWLLNEQPNNMYSAAVFWEYLLSSLLLHGDAFAIIQRRNNYSPVITGFEAIHPLAVTVDVLKERLVYTVHRKNGSKQVLDQDDMLHVPNIGFDGTRGLSNIKNALRQSGGIALAADQYSADFFKNGARPDFVLTAEGKVSPEQAEMIRTTWADRHTGSGKHHLPAILHGGINVKELTMTAEDAQLLTTRQFQIEDIARIFGVPPFMIGRNEKTSSWGSGIEQMGIGFVKYTLAPYIVKIQQEVNRKCFRNITYFCEFNTAGLERGDIKTRYEAYRIAIGRAGEPGFKTPNEVRKLENEPPKPGGDTLSSGNSDKSGENNASDPKTASGQ